MEDIVYSYYPRPYNLIPEFDTSKKRKNRKQAQKISILCGFFELFLLTNTENYDIIYLI